MATATKTRKSYNPGKPGAIIPEGNGRFIVESFRNEGESYSVDLVEWTCTCPHFINRLAVAAEPDENAVPCKHIRAAEDASYVKALGIAHNLPVETLRRRLQKNNLRREVALAVCHVLRYHESMNDHREENPVYAA